MLIEDQMWFQDIVYHNQKLKEDMVGFHVRKIYLRFYLNAGCLCKGIVRWLDRVGSSVSLNNWTMHYHGYMGVFPC